MLEFFEQYGAVILTAVIAVAGAITSTTSMLKTFKTNKRINTLEKNTNDNITITREGIVNAFKQAKLPSDLKVSLSNQLRKQLDAGLKAISDEINKNEATRTAIMIAILKILNYTAASNKLTPEEKAQLEKLLDTVEHDEDVIDITE